MTKLNKGLTKAQEKGFVIRQILEMRFGDGTGDNPQIGIATKEIMVELAKQKKEIIEELEKMKELKPFGWISVAKPRTFDWDSYEDATHQAIKTIKEMK